MSVNEDIAKAVLRRLVGHELRHEFDVPGAPVRADAVDISLEALVGWEIKTAQDTTKRLTGQVAGYDRFFDHCWLFTAPQHANVELPEWWGLAVFEAKPFAAFDWPPGWSHEQHEEWRRHWARRFDRYPVTADLGAKGNEGRDLAACCPRQPVGKERYSFLALQVDSKAQLLFHQVRPVQPVIRVRHPRQLVLLTAGQALRVLPQRVAAALQLVGQRLVTTLAPGLVPHLTADLVERVGRPLDRMESVHVHLRVQTA